MNIESSGIGRIAITLCKWKSNQFAIKIAGTLSRI